MSSTLAAVAVGDSVQQGLNAFFGFLPNLLGFLLILLVGWVIAKVVRTAIVAVLGKVGVDRALHSGHAGQYVDRVAPDSSPSRVIGAIAYWFILLGAIGIAVSALKIPLLDSFIAGIASYLPNVVAAILIFVVAGAIAAAVGALVARTMGDTPTGKVVGSVVPVLVMAIAAFMILNQLAIAPEIVTITYAALLGGVALAMALAFGLGGREVAAGMLAEAYETGRQQRGQVRRDMEVGKDRGRQDVERAKAEAERRSASDGRTETGAHAGPER
jgi:hypothetical protein